jgi:predicted Holliday junction resolvase-like endonuclease
LLFTPPLLPLLLLPENEEEEEEEEEEREEERREAKVVEVEAKVGGERREQLAHVFMSLLSFKFLQSDVDSSLLSSRDFFFPFFLI